MDATDAPDAAARAGLAAQGVLYAVVGVLALQVAFGDHGERADKDGALRAVSRQPLGMVMLAVLAVGTALYALWRLSMAWRGDEAHKRVADVGRAAIYVSVTGTALEYLRGEPASGGSGQERAWSAKVLGWPGGVWIVGAVGLVIVGVALWQWRNAVTAKFLEKLRTDSAVVAAIGRVGYFGRGLAFGIVGWFVIQAALDFDPDEATGLDGALQQMAGQPYGPWVLLAVAVGLFAFGLYRLCDARFRTAAET